ncbi:MAG: division/cell wall cluster transcriptional repressor MraZ [Myxococcales bacterium]|nr:division/cell wall cluster transcriptional repressor MraZ [Myxococcales bacterium]
MFRGRYEHAIDAKGRTSLPSRFREVLSAMGEARVVITTGLDPCLLAYPMKEWVAFEDKVAQASQFDRSVKTLRRVMLSGAVECDLDKLGRLLIPATLRKHAGLKREALWAGMGTHVELWDKARFEALTTGVLEDDDEREAIESRLAELEL